MRQLARMTYLSLARVYGILKKNLKLAKLGGYPICLAINERESVSKMHIKLTKLYPKYTMIIKLLVMRPWYTILSQNVKVLTKSWHERMQDVFVFFCVIFTGKKGTLLQIPVPNDKTVTCNFYKCLFIELIYICIDVYIFLFKN